MDPRPHAQTPINGKWTDGDGTSGGKLPPSVLPAANATVEHGDSEDELDDLDGSRAASFFHDLID